MTQITDDQVMDAVDELLNPIASVGARQRDGSYRVSEYETGLKFVIQVVPVVEFENMVATDDTFVSGGLWFSDKEPPRIDVGNREFVVLRQW